MLYVANNELVNVIRFLDVKVTFSTVPIKVKALRPVIDLFNVKKRTICSQLSVNYLKNSNLL